MLLSPSADGIVAASCFCLLTDTIVTAQLYSTVAFLFLQKLALPPSYFSLLTDTSVTTPLLSSSYETSVAAQSLSPSYGYQCYYPDAFSFYGN